MRVTGGILRGRTLRAPGGRVRPTQDKVRAALFSSLGEAVVGARVLDLFAGSGALGIEAWSRGASFVCWVEADRAVLRVLRGNVVALCRGEGGRTACVAADALRFLRRDPDAPFDIVLADPPYDRAGQRRWLENALLALERGSILAPDGVLVFELGSRENAVRRPGWRVLREKVYGDTRLLMYRRGPGEGAPAGEAAGS